MFGVQEPDCYCVLDLDSGLPTLFVPKLSNLYKIWMTVLTREDYTAKYDIPDVKFVEELEAWLADRKPAKIYLNNGVCTDSDLPNIIPEDKYWKPYEAIVDQDTMYESLAESRVTKTAQEVDVLRWATKITVEAHVEVMRRTRDGMRENELESIFKAFGE